jgi:hypothetical protein
MKHSRHIAPPQEPCEIVDFDEALLDACSPEERTDLMTEARILAHALGEADLDKLEALARDLSVGARDQDMDRAHARKLSAALRRLAKHPWD